MSNACLKSSIAAVLHLIDGQVRRKRNRAKREQRVRLWNGDDAFAFTYANAPLLLQTQRDARSMKKHIQQTCDCHGKDRTKQQRKDEPFPKCGKVEMRPRRCETT